MTSSAGARPAAAVCCIGMLELSGRLNFNFFLVKSAWLWSSEYILLNPFQDGCFYYSYYISWHYIPIGANCIGCWRTFLKKYNLTFLSRWSLRSSTKTEIRTQRLGNRARYLKAKEDIFIRAFIVYWKVGWMISSTHLSISNKSLLHLGDLPVGLPENVY